MTQTQIFLVGLYGVDNLGDDAIREAIEKASKTLAVEVRHYAVRRECPGEPRAVRLRGRGWWAYLHAIWRADRVVIGGGGLLKDEGIKRWQGYGLLLELYATAAIARLLGKNVSLLGIGVGPIYTKLGAWLIGPIARLAQCRLVRDDASARILEDLGIRDIDVHADPAFSMRDQMISDNSHADRKQWPPRRMLISVRPWFLMAHDGVERWRQLVAGIAQLADEAIEDGLAVEFVCLYWPEDREAAEEIAAAMRYGGQVTVPSTPIDWWELARKLRHSDVLVAMRYHAVVCATLTRTPVFALAYEPKVVSLAADCDTPMLNVNLRDNVGSMPAAVRDFRLARAPAPPPTAIEEATATMSGSAWEGLRKALIT